MQVHRGEGVAIHTGPESCGARREACVEALTGERAGRPLSRDRVLPRGADAVEVCGRQHGRVRERECPAGPAWSETPACTDSPCAETGRSAARPSIDRSRVRIGKAGGRSR